jgi:phosphoribosylformylglycinamidine synthase
MYKAEVYIALKETVADPQGLTIKHALESLDYGNIDDVRIGKMVTLKLDVKDEKQAQNQLNNMCRKLLANPIIEDFKFKIEKA